MHRPFAISMLALGLLTGCQQTATNRSPYAQPAGPPANGMYGYGPVVGSPMFMTMPNGRASMPGGLTPLGMAPQNAIARQPMPMPPSAPQYAAPVAPSWARPMPAPATAVAPQPTNAAPSPMMAANATTNPTGSTSFWPPQAGTRGFTTYPQPTPATQRPLVATHQPVAPTVPYEPMPTPAVRPTSMAQRPTPASLPAYQPYPGNATAPTTSR